MTHIQERGEAIVIIDLHDGIITVRHSELNHSILARWTANAGDWHKIWESITELKKAAI